MSYGCGSKACTPGKQHNRWQMDVHPPQNGIAIGSATHGHIALFQVWIFLCHHSSMRLHAEPGQMMPDMPPHPAPDAVPEARTLDALNGWCKWPWFKTNRIPFWGFRCTTHFRTYFSGWIGMFTGATIWVLTHGQMTLHGATTPSFVHVSLWPGRLRRQPNSTELQSQARAPKRRRLKGLDANSPGL